MRAHGFQRPTLRATLAWWVFFAAFAPAAVVMVTTVLILGARELPLLLGAVLGPLFALAVISAVFASIVARYVTVPLTRVRALAVLAARPEGETLQLCGAADREPYRETAAVMDALEALRKRATWEGKRRDQLASFVAHDLRTPISAVAMRLAGRSVLHDRTELACQLRWVLTEVDQLVTALRAGVDVERGDEERTTDVEALVRSLVPTVAGSAGLEINLRVLRPFAAAMPPSAVRAVTQNLMSNAIRHAAGAVVVEIALGVVQVWNDRRVVGGAVEYGPLELQRHGLGLAIARHVLNAHGGRLKAVSDDDRGYAVVAYMPVADGRDST